MKYVNRQTLTFIVLGLSFTLFIDKAFSFSTTQATERNHMQQQTIKLIGDYYHHFNTANMPAFYNLLDENVIHDINNGKREVGKAAFMKFMDHMNATKKRLQN